MSAEYDDKMLEAGLEEVVGGHYPPDLTAAILQAWEARQQAAARAALAAEDVAPPLVTAAATLPVAPPVHSLAEPEPPPRHGEATVRVAPGLRATGRSPQLASVGPGSQSPGSGGLAGFVCRAVSLADLPVGRWPSPASTATPPSTDPMPASLWSIAPDPWPRRSRAAKVQPGPAWNDRADHPRENNWRQRPPANHRPPPSHPRRMPRDRLPSPASPRPMAT